MTQEEMEKWFFEMSKKKSWESQQRKTCRKKQTFKTVTDAAIKMSANWWHNKIMTHIYQCDVCQQFHLTSGGLK